MRLIYPQKGTFRTIRGLEAINEVLKELLYDKQIQDKKSISHLSGYIGGSIERLKKEYKRKSGGLFNKIKSLFGFVRRS
jgi:hypothetical protein